MLGEAMTGYVSIGLVVEVCSIMGVLPVRTLVVEVEPLQTEPGAPLSPACAVALERALELVREEVYSALGSSSRIPSA